jgi:hypothetical protein
MTERNKLKCPFGRLYTGNLRDIEHIAFLNLIFFYQLHRGLRKRYSPNGARYPALRNFVADIHHSGSALIVGMR